MTANEPFLRPRSNSIPIALIRAEWFSLCAAIHSNSSTCLKLVLLAPLAEGLPGRFPNFVLGRGQSPLRATAFCVVGPASFWARHGTTTKVRFVRLPHFPLKKTPALFAVRLLPRNPRIGHSNSTREGRLARSEAFEMSGTNLGTSLGTIQILGSCT